MEENGSKKLELITTFRTELNSEHQLPIFSQGGCNPTYS
jgi:hypothetical protein